MRYDLVYGGFDIEFLVPEKLVEYFSKYDEDIGVFLGNSWQWFEVILFELIDDCTNEHNSKFGKSFTVVFDAIIFGFKDDVADMELFDVDCPTGKKFSMQTENIKSKFLVRYSIFAKP